MLFKWMGNKRLFLLMFSFILFIVIMGLSLGKRGTLTWPEKAFKDSISWTQGLLYKPARSIAGFFGDVHQLSSVYNENQVMKKNLFHYTVDTMRLNYLEDENSRLKTLLQFTEKQKKEDQYNYRVAAVVAESPDPYNHLISIDLGSEDGIKKNMAVVSVDGLVGRIEEVRPLTSNVQLLTDLDGTDKTMSIPATTKGKERDSFGIVERFDPTMSPKGMLVMTKIPSADPMKIGDTIVTSGAGRVFPSGIVIGKVVKKEVGDFGIANKAYIQPSSAFHHLQYVLVVEVPK